MANQSDIQQQFPVESQAQETSGKCHSVNNFIISLGQYHVRLLSDCNVLTIRLQEYTLLHYLLRLLEVLEGRGDTLSASDRSKVDRIRTIVEDDGYIGDDRDLHVAGFMTFIATQSCPEIVKGSWEEYMSSEIGTRIQTIVEARR